jgi:hypothetical protein
VNGGARIVTGVAAGLLTVALSGCSGSGKNNAGVASLSGAGSGAGSGSPTTVAGGGKSVAQLYHQWADCMRQHGMQMNDPVVDAQGQINVDIQGVNQDTFQTANDACKALHTAAQNAARGGKPVEKPDPAKMLNFAKCMRAHGLPDFPDPTGGGLQIRSSPGSDLSPDNPTFQNAQKACQSIIGAPKGGGRTRVSGGPGGPGGPGGGSGSGGAVSGGG